MVLHLLADWTHDVTGVADVHSFGRFVPPPSAQCRLTVHQQPKARAPRTRRSICPPSVQSCLSNRSRFAASQKTSSHRPTLLRTSISKDAGFIRGTHAFRRWRGFDRQGGVVGPPANRLEKVLYTAKAHTKGGRAGMSRSSDGRLEPAGPRASTRRRSTAC